MKKIYIVGIVMIAAAIALFTMAGKDLTTYSSFKDAVKANGHTVKIAGELAKDKEMYYNPAEDPNYFSFYVKDTDGEERKVVLFAEKPQDFEMSEQIVLTGAMKGDEFHAESILMKCPSKYKDEEIYIKSEKEENS
ncbi:MAG: cytochrome c maturation protein CcmE [Phaeodactylibacter sp.]|nr:cytochrome c maturation protein CcmE [Phaeodactylibacter sp.]